MGAVAPKVATFFFENFLGRPMEELPKKPLTRTPTGSRKNEGKKQDENVGKKTG